MTLFKEYRNIFGKPNEGVHSYRIFNLALIDVVFTILAAFIITYYNNNMLNTIFIKNLLINIAILFFMAIIFHLLFAVNTTINTYIFGTIA
jgi:hypothetical protein